MLHIQPMAPAPDLRISPQALIQNFLDAAFCTPRTLMPVRSIIAALSCPLDDFESNA
jgi:hypothetical protein